ncbi:MAG: SdrD B-like domain-containing protein [Caldilineaceae bacterium]
MSDRHSLRNMIMRKVSFRRVRYLCNLILAIALGLQWVPAFAAAGVTHDLRARDTTFGIANVDWASAVYSPTYFGVGSAGTITNTVSVGSTTTDPEPLNNTAIQTTTVTSEADLQISKDDGLATVTPGTTVTYTIIVNNNGPSAVSGATVTDTLPSAITSATWSCVASSGSSCGAANGTDNINTTVDLAVSGVATFTVVADINWQATGSLVNTATVTPPVDTTDPVPGNNSSTDTDTLLTGTLTGTVYIDTNDNSSGDSGEGWPNVTVVITTSVGVTFTVTTDANGHYTATVPAGATIVAVDETDLPTGAVQIEGTDPTTVNVPAGGSASDIDGYEVRGQVYGHIYEDTNGDGNQDSGEPNLAGVQVVIIDTFGVTQTLTTDANGNYTATVPVSNLSTLTDTVTVDVVESTLPTGSVQTAGTDPNSGQVVAGTLTHVGDDGYQPQGLVEGVVYMDEDGDGIYTDGVDTPLENITVIITDSNGMTYTVVTNANGAYSQTVPAGDTIVDVDDGDPDLPADVVLTGGSTDSTTVTVPGGGTARDDTGYVLLATIGDRVWLDLNGDSVQDANEPGLSGVVISLTLPSSVVITTTTGPSGYYNFSDLRPGSYTIEVDTSTLPAGVTQTFDRDGTLNDATSLTLVSGDSITDTDFGYQGGSSIGDLLWLDRDGDGVLDGGEPGIPGVVVTLTMPSGWVVTATTSVTGFYTFVGLIPGTYTVTVDTATLPVGAVQTHDRDSTLDDETVVTLGAATTITTADFAYQRQGLLTGFVFEDIDGSGAWNGSEPGLATITVIMTDSMGLVYTTTTDANGNYTFTVPIDSLTALTDTVTVDVDESTLVGIGWVYTAGADPEAIEVTANTTTDAGGDGYQRQGLIEGYVYEDVNQNGVYDLGTDIALSVTVTITDSNGVAYSVGTDSDGYFSQVVPYGTTTVDVNDGDIFTISPDLMLENGFVDPDSVNVPAGTTVTTYFPYVEPLVIDKDVVTPNVVAGTQVTYTIAVRNIGAYTLTNVTISDTLPMSFTYAGSTLSASNANRTVATGPTGGEAIPTWGAWRINPGGAITVTLVADVGSDVVAGSYDNDAYANSDQTSMVDDLGGVQQDPNTPAGEDPENDEDVTVTTVADLAVAKYDDPDPVAAGATLTYTIIITNYGPSNAQNVVITDTLSNDVTLVSATGCTPSGNQIICNFGTIANGGTRSVTIVVTVNSDLLVAAASDGSALVQAPMPASESVTNEAAIAAISPVKATSPPDVAAIVPLAAILAAASPGNVVTGLANAAIAALAQANPAGLQSLGRPANVTASPAAESLSQNLVRDGPLPLT